MAVLLYFLTQCEQEKQSSLLEKVQMPNPDIEPGIEDGLESRTKNDGLGNNRKPGLDWIED